MLMQIIHMADLHLGKVMDGVELLPFQKRILMQGVLSLLKEKKPNVLVLTGDIFDSYYPDDVTLAVYARFLTAIHSVVPKIIVVGGNHDNPILIEYLSGITAGSGIFCFGKNNKYLPEVAIEDEFGPVHFYILPFLQNRFVANFSHPLRRKGATEIVEELLLNTSIDFNHRNVLLGHQYVYSFEEAKRKGEILGPQLDMIEIQKLSIFDFVCLGHIHEAKRLGNNIGYSGAPYPMHYSDSGEKYVSLITLEAKGDVQQTFLPISNDVFHIVVYHASISDCSALPDNDEDYVYVVFDTDVIPRETEQEMRLKYPRFCRCLGRNAGRIPTVFERDYVERNIEYFDISWIAQKIGIQNEDEKSLLIQTLLKKMKGKLNHENH